MLESNERITPKLEKKKVKEKKQSVLLHVSVTIAMATTKYDDVIVVGVVLSVPTEVCIAGGSITPGRAYNGRSGV